jgi:hypothetical protein
MSEILVVVPPEWSPVSYDEVSGMTGFDWTYWKESQGRGMADINDRLANWLPAGMRVMDVLVINEQLFFKYEAAE